ncbi:outer membrane beta-barrel family protein, partial [Flavobacterium psychrophilum]
LSENSSISLNYSKRITRPRDRFINPFASYTSNINLFQGNPDINPALSDAYDIGYLHKWDKVTLSTSAYFNHTTNSFQIVRKERGDQINGVPVIINTPFNLAIEDKTGFEFTLNYNFKKWFKLNGNFNFFNNKTTGNYTYTNSQNTLKVQNFDFNTNTWFARITSKISLPYKIDWQTNATYTAPQKYRQGTMNGVAAVNMGFSKDILKDMGTISINVNDVFNSRKRIQDLQLPTVNSYSEMQNRKRQITISFTYRFNKKKTDKDPKQKQNENGESENMG